MNYVRGIAGENEWKMLTDPEWKKLIEGNPPVINGIINSYRNGYMKGVVILCPFCCCNHIHGGEITKSGIYGIRVSHCLGKEGGSYWINIPEKALIIAKTYKWSFDAYSNYDKFHKRAKTLLKYFNGYVPDWMKVMDQRAKVFNKLKRLFRPSKHSYKSIKKGSVYFISAPEINRVKIGFTSLLVENRLTGLQTSSPFRLKIEFSIEGSTEKERELHHRFHHLRKSGEWFDFNDEIKQYINEVV